MAKLRKMFTISVMAITVLSMSVIVAPDVNAAATAGDLIKTDAYSTVYYLGDDGKRYGFPNEATFFSWYDDFSGVMTISQDELESYRVAGMITMRPGTNLVKIQSDPRVYAVEPGGALRWIDSEETAIALYGADWATTVVDVPDAFIGNYTVNGQAYGNSTDADITATALDGSAYPAGSVVQWEGSDDVYYIDANGQAQKFTDEAAMSANRFLMSDVIAATSVAMPAMGTVITGADADLTDPIMSSTVAEGGSGLSVALSSDSPASATIIADSTANEYPQALIPFVKVNFTASADGDVDVTNVKFTRSGISSDSDLGTLYLYDGNTKLAEYTSFSDKLVTFSNSSGLFTVPAGETKTVTLKGDLARGSTSVSSGKTIGFSLESASNVATASGASISGSFPLSGNLMSTASVTDLGHLYFTGASGSNGSYPATIKADEASKELWSVNVTADSQDMEIRYIKFTMVGTIDSDDIRNITLEVAGEEVAGPVEMNSDKSVIFDLTDSPIALTSGQTKALAIRGDMFGGSGRVFKFTIQKITDLVVYDTEYGVYVDPNVNSVTTAFGVVQPTTGNGTSVDAGTLTLGVATDSPTGNIPDGATGVTLAKFSLYAAGEDVKVDSLTASSTCTGLNEALVNFKLLLNGSQVGTTDSSLTCDGSDSSSFTFGNTFVVPAGETSYLTVVADTTNTNIAADDTVIVALQAGSGNASGQDTLTSISTTAQTARTLTVKSGTASVVENTAFTDRSSSQPSGTVSASDAKIASFIITAGAGEGIKVTQIKLADDATSQLGDNFQNLKLMHDGVQVGTTIGSLNATAGTYTFSPATAIEIAAGQQYVVDVYADIKSSPDDSATVLSPVVAFDKVTATGLTTGASADYEPVSNVDLQNAYISAQGNLTITKDNDSTLAQQILMGSTELELAKFKFTADAAEAINLDKIVLSDIVSSTATGTLKNLKLYVDGEQIGQTVNFTTNYASTTYAAFEGFSLTIPKDGNKIVTVKADVNTYDAGGLSASTHQLALLTTYDGTNEPISGVGASSGQSITGAYLDLVAATDADVQANTMQVYRALISASWASDTPSGAAVGGTDSTVAKINITNSNNVGGYDATISALNFAISQTGVSNTADRNLKIYKDTISAGNLLETTSWLAAGNQNFGNTAITDAGMTDAVISAGTTKLFIVTLDTNDAGNDDKISIYVDSSDVTWEDGVTSDITSVNTLPLTAKTLTY